MPPDEWLFDPARNGLADTAPSSIAILNMPDRHAFEDLAALGPCRSAIARSARLTTPVVTSRSRSSPSAGTTWLPTTERYVRSVPVDHRSSEASHRSARSF